MKTQINNLTSGTKNQILNPSKDYSLFPKATSHNGHAGSNNYFVKKTWELITKENPETIKIELKGQKIELQANWSTSKLSCHYYSPITNEEFELITGLKATKHENSYVSFQFANVIEVSNGKNSTVTICPSLITIL